MAASLLLNLPPHSLFHSTPPKFHHSSPIFHSHHIAQYPLQASKRVSNFPQDDSRSWSGNRSGIVIGEYDEGDGDDDEEEEEDRSLDLLVRFVQNVFKKVSRKARKAVRSVLPINISTQLVGFSVNGVIILAFLWVLKAFLEVVCTLGTVVFVSILLIRGIWTGISYLQERRSFRTYEVDDDDHHAWSQHNLQFDL